MNRLKQVDRYELAVINRQEQTEIDIDKYIQIEIHNQIGRQTDMDTL